MAIDQAQSFEAAMLVYLNTYGGLGNQVFQLLAALRISRSSVHRRILICDSAHQYAEQRSIELGALFEVSALGANFASQGSEP